MTTGRILMTTGRILMTTGIFMTVCMIFITTDHVLRQMIQYSLKQSV